MTAAVPAVATADVARRFAVPAVTTADPGLVWLAVAAIGLGTFAIRLSFLLVLERVSVPPLAERALALVPAAVLSALVAPTLVVADGGPAVWGNDRLLAGAVATVVAWYTEDILATIVAGMGALLVLQALL